MKNRIAVILVIVLAALMMVLPACAEDAAASAFKTETVAIASGRNVDIPAIVTLPEGDGAHPAVIMMHGHGGSKDEAGMFVKVADALAAKGYLTVRFDFPGCGDSKDDFVANNNLSTMLSDIKTVKAYLLTRKDVDAAKLGLFGYSMGGRLAVLTGAEDPDYKAICLLAPAATNGGAGMYTFMKTDEAGFKKLMETAEKDGKVTYSTIFGYDQTLGAQWFKDMTDKALDPEAALAKITTPVLIIHGDADIIVPDDAIATVKSKLTAAKSVDIAIIKGADHGYGAYSNQPDLTQGVADAAADFFSKNL